MELREDITLNGVEFVEEGGRRMLRNLVLLGPISKHGYTYSQGAMAKAIRDGLYESCRLFVDHSPKDAKRSIMDLAGSFTNVRHEAGKIKGDAILLNDQWGQKVWDIAKTMPHAAGFSHVASGTMRREGIRESISVFNTRQT